MARYIAPDAQEAIATATFVRISPTKARQVVDLIRGRHVDDARRVLRFTPRAAATDVGKILESAVANAEHNRGLPTDELVVARAWVDEGPTLKRYRPRAMGRATRVRKRTCHISVVVGRLQEEAPLPERPATRQTRRRVRKDTTGGPAAEPSATATSEATEAAPATTSKTTRKRTTKKSTASTDKSTAKKTTAKKTTAKKTTAKKTTRRKPDDEKDS
ncbi:MAG: large subunit ribosomal protein [Actinomycetota bacterium]|nr:large subunit ribosomal protein [Actinomycetota bacterium]MEA2487693.1 large subunit ribosomal protein [Actinomycetota bacterium]